MENLDSVAVLVDPADISSVANAIHTMYGHKSALSTLYKQSEVNQNNLGPNLFQEIENSLVECDRLEQDSLESDDHEEELASLNFFFFNASDTPLSNIIDHRLILSPKGTILQNPICNQAKANNQQRLNAFLHLLSAAASVPSKPVSGPPALMYTPRRPSTSHQMYVPQPGSSATPQASSIISPSAGGPSSPLHQNSGHHHSHNVLYPQPPSSASLSARSSSRMVATKAPSVNVQEWAVDSPDSQESDLHSASFVSSSSIFSSASSSASSSSLTLNSARYELDMARLSLTTPMDSPIPYPQTPMTPNVNSLKRAGGFITRPIIPPISSSASGASSSRNACLPVKNLFESIDGEVVASERMDTFRRSTLHVPSTPTPRQPNSARPPRSPLAMQRTMNEESSAHAPMVTPGRTPRETAAERYDRELKQQTYDRDNVESEDEQSESPEEVQQQIQFYDEPPRPSIRREAIL